MELKSKVKEIMSSDLIIVEPHMQLSQFRRDFKAKGIHHVLVENDLGHLVGIISLNDILKEENLATSGKLTADKLMTLNPECINEEQTVDTALNIFLKNMYRALPVTNADAELVGIITPYDILNHIAKL